MTEVERLRGTLADLWRRGESGDLVRRRYEAQVAERGVELARAVVAEKLQQGERVVAEHHVVLGHTRLASSVLREGEQESISLFLTPSRLLRLRSRLRPGAPVTCDAADGTVLDGTALARIRTIRTRRQIRHSQAVAGLVIAGVSLLAWAWLEVTGPLLLAIGVLGTVHAVAVPTRWIEVEADGSAGSFEVWVLRRRSARRFVRLLRQMTGGAAA